MRLTWPRLVRLRPGAHEHPVGTGTPAAGTDSGCALGRTHIRSAPEHLQHGTCPGYALGRTHIRSEPEHMQQQLFRLRPEARTPGWDRNICSTELFRLRHGANNIRSEPEHLQLALFGLRPAARTQTVGPETRAAR